MFESLKNTKASVHSEPLLLRFKRFVSRFTSKDIYTGYGISIDSTTVMSKPVSKELMEAAQAKTTNLYRLKEDAGHFEVVGFATDQRGTDKAFFKLRHILTGTTVKVPKNVMELIFERTTVKGNPNDKA